MTLLELTNVSASYGTIPALHDVTLAVAPGEAVALLGANGAGKTTTLRAISRLVETTGTLRLEDQDLSSLRPDQVARLGIAHVPEGRGTLTELSVEENLVLGAYGQPRKVIRERMNDVYDTLPILHDRIRQRAGTLSGGEQQMLAIGRALMAEPKLLLLDEPSLGLAPVATEAVYEVIAKSVQERELTVLLAEQDIGYALDLADRAYILQAGYVRQSGKADELPEHLLDTYLG